MDAARPSYGRVAWCYDAIAAGYSGGAIDATKTSQIEHLHAGDRVLYAGVGSGADALLAAQKGAQVVGLDVSPRMLGRFDARLRHAGLRAEIVRESLFDHAREAEYDAVCANFVLNVFSLPLLRRALAQLTRLLRPDGRLLIADFAPPAAGFAGVGARAYYRPINIAAWALRLCSLHPIHDYAPLLGDCDLAVVRRDRFAIFGRGPRWFESLVAVRAATTPAAK